uniref:Uncharacterized protein n=1 Tax=Macaca fascicularis TaxID=9541 RepID=A0A7N9CS98_MACFA
CWRLDLALLRDRQYLKCITLNINQKNHSRVHVYNVQVCYICIHVPCWCAVPINLILPILSLFTSL